MNDLASVLGAGLIVILVAAVVALLVVTILFRAATKWVAKQDVSFGMSIGIVILGIIASIATNVPASLMMALIGLPEIMVTIIGFVISFCATSCVYFLMLKINFWKASLIQIVSLILFLILVFVVAILFGGLAAAL
tara:strand:+ start:84 stop:491 length:408 start_codon:yes stop_codon:yes gene_type:complete